MKYFLIFFVILFSNSCQLFQTQQPVVTTPSVETTQQVEEQQTEKFVPIEKELYVINTNEPIVIQNLIKWELIKRVIFS